MTSSNKKRNIQLGMSFSTAQNRLRKMIMFRLLQKAKSNVCFQCLDDILTVEELSIEHMIPWLDSENPKELFFDLDNIAFSHLSCNCSSGGKKGNTRHPSIYAYKKGCRCSKCTELHRLEMKRYRGIV